MALLAYVVVIVAYLDAVHSKQLEMVKFEPGAFLMGLSKREKYAVENGESPARIEILRRPFALSRFPITNAQFKEFMEENPQHRTGAFSKGYSYALFSSCNEATDTLIEAYSLPCEPWWRAVFRLTWDTNAATTPYWNYLPVVHVDRDDAVAFCKWVSPNYRLASEFEWEYAVRGGSNASDLYPWGRGFRRGRINSWQGIFPTINHALDGYPRRSPVEAFPAQTRAGLYDMLGNVWEWTSTSLSGKNSGERLKNCSRENGKPIQNLQDLYVITKGGSFIDSVDGSGTGSAIRNSARLARPSTFTSENIGFRCAETTPTAAKSPESMKVYKREVYEKPTKKERFNQDEL